MRKQHTTTTTPADPRAALIAQRNDLMTRLSGRSDTEVERYADPIDEAVQLSQREQAAGVVSAETALLRQVTDALQRLDAGRYGVCDGCGEPIPPTRLAALPWAAMCVTCATAAEMAGVGA
jgi:RNA polymerase-binding protein DksA